MSDQMSGKNVNRDIVMMLKITKRTRFRKKKMVASVFMVSEPSAYGKLWKRLEMAPVPVQDMGGSFRSEIG